jgi:SAM-dependent methyltransferase
MSIDFTGERVVPGQVDIDLWNEHVARYAFASRFAQGRRILDAGCGTGYGSAVLSPAGRSVIGVDVSIDAVRYAAEHYADFGAVFLCAPCEQLPFRTGSFDLVVAFEVIEHLENWSPMLEEARRVLSPGGLFIVSTPNKAFYAEFRKDAGPNPFHTHEFEYREFQEALLERFPYVSLFLQDHADGIIFRSRLTQSAAELHVGGDSRPPEESSFFIAICSAVPVPAASSFIYVPAAANVLRERSNHIQALEAELKEARQQHHELLAVHRAQTADLEASNTWAADLDQRLKAAGERIVAMQAEIEKIAGDLHHQTAELGKCVEILHATEAEVEERTKWALDLESRRVALESKLAMLEASRWIRLGRSLGVGPQVWNS